MRHEPWGGGTTGPELPTTEAAKRTEKMTRPLRHNPAEVLVRARARASAPDGLRGLGGRGRQRRHFFKTSPDERRHLPKGIAGDGERSIR